MYSLIRYPKNSLSTLNPLAGFSDVRDQLERLFDLSFSEPSARAGWSPVLDVFQNEDAVVVKAELPGFKKEDLSLTLHEGALSITGERKHEESANGEVFRRERFFGRFERAVALPVAVDASEVKAAYQDGILTVTLPKAEEAKPKQIEVKVA